MDYASAEAQLRKDVVEDKWSALMEVILLVKQLEQQENEIGQKDSITDESGPPRAGVQDVGVLSGSMVQLKVDEANATAVPPLAVGVSHLAVDVLAVGSVLEGDINIPGMGSDTNSSTPMMHYRLEVLREERDEMGRWVLMGKHAAYGDEQICQLNVVQDPEHEGLVLISYADGETHCSGTIDVAARTIVGNVQQLLMGEEGFFVPSAKVTHTFRLHLKPESYAARQLRTQVGMARQRRIEVLAMLLDDETAASKIADPQVNSVLKELKMNDLLEDAMALVERVCAVMRRQADELQSLKFVTPQERMDFLAKLGSKGMSLLSAHAAADAALLSIRHVFELQQHFGALGSDLESVLKLMFKAQHRLELSYARLDKALKGAQRRLPLDLISSWKRSARVLGGTRRQDSTCMICLLEVGEDDMGRDNPLEGGGLMLPCGHQFHEECARSWLHSHTTCPCCRAHLETEVQVSQREVGLSAEAESSEAEVEAGDAAAGGGRGGRSRGRLGANASEEGK